MCSKYMSSVSSYYDWWTAEIPRTGSSVVEHGQAWSLVACPNPARFVLIAHIDTLNFFVDGIFSATQSAYSNIETLP